MINWGTSFGLVGVMTVSLSMCLVLRRYAKPLGLEALPGGHRLHESPTPMVGGLGICVGIICGLFFIDSSYLELMPSLVLLCLVGALDDRYSLPSWARFLAQGVAAYLMIQFTGTQLHSLGYLIGNDEVLLEGWSVAMTIFATIGVINAVNMSDGHDGLVASLLTLILIALLTLGLELELVLITLASLLGFLVLNVRIFRKRASVFMGDAGSTMLGMLLAYLLIEYSQTEGGIQPVTALWIMALPLIDAVSVLLARPIKGKSPFSADRIHYHHLLVDRGVSVNKMLAMVLLIQTVLICVGFWARSSQIPDHFQLMAFLTLFFAYLIVLLTVTRSTNTSQIGE